MDISDTILWQNQDWDPCYLSSIFDVDFNDFSDLWTNNMSDLELVEAVKDVESYSPIVEDISLDNTELCSAVEKIEERYLFLWFQ